MLFRFLLIITCLSVFFSCNTSNADYEASLSNPEYIHRSVKKFSDIIVYDIFSPPVASRNYAYPCIAAYEVMASNNNEYHSLAGQLKGFELGPVPPVEEYSSALASFEAFLTAGKQFIFSEDQFAEYKEELYKEIRETGISSAVFKRSVAYGQAMANHVLAYADKDNYKQTRTFPKYSITQDEARWKPTPPGYMDGIEPHWTKIRPFVLDSSSQFVPTPPTTFSKDKNSPFYKEVLEVYNVVKDGTPVEQEIARFWDCNPYKLNVTGHVMHATKKITPGGHWIGITAIACRKENADFAKTLEAYTLTSIALFDGFISCWDEKYRSNLVRPETVINELIDEDWVPLLQTPPFPEHTSGHSVISRASAAVLTSVFGENFAFDDDTELEYGLPVRSFNSFYQASEEAAVSRLYGGIHYRPAIDYGVKQGQLVGDFILSKIQLRKSE